MIPEEALQIVLNYLEECGISYMISGSFASNVHGVPRVTGGADVIVEADLRALLRFIGRLGDDFYADAEAAKDAFAGNRMFNIIHLPTGFKVDLILRKTRDFSKEEFLRRQHVEFLCRARWFTTAEDTILAKLEWSRIGQSERQFNDALNVAKVQGETLDRTYLLKWAKELCVDTLLQKLFAELEV
jgi:hypothetical protein